MGKYLFFEDITDRLHSQNSTKWQIIIIVILFVIIIFILVSGSIMKFSRELNTFYQETIATIKENESYLKAVENGSKNLVFTIYNREVFTANREFLVFIVYDILDAFKK